MTVRNISLLIILVSLGLLSQYCPDLSQQSFKSTGTDVVVIDENLLDSESLKKDLETKNSGLVSKIKPEDIDKKIEGNTNKPKAPIIKTKSDSKIIIIGKNLKVGLTLHQAIKVLGTPKSIKVKRGIESKLDSMSIEYFDRGITIHVVSEKKRIETIELSNKFNGEFAKGIKIGEKVSVLIDKLGIPQSIDSSIARYPKKGIHFNLKNKVLVSAYIFKK